MTATTVRVPTVRLRPAVEAAIEAWKRGRRAEVEKALAALMAPPVLTWWERLLRIDPGAPLTREQALERLKCSHDSWRTPEYELIWLRGRASLDRLSALKDACDLALDAVDVAVEDVALFKAHYDPRTEGYR